ncbi:MAG: acyltransferase [Oceanicaulis sp.]
MTSANPSASLSPGRRHDLDWLRIGAFTLLIAYHCGMYFNTEGWHAKSVHASAAIEPVMWLSSPWRLSLLFFISGVAMRYLLDKRGAGAFAVDRVWRLAPVIVFGMAVIVPPQTWAELRAAGVIGAQWRDFLPYWTVFGGPWEVATPTWNHLWYVVYLLVYALILAVLHPLLKRAGEGAEPVLFHRAAVLIAPAAVFLAVRFGLAARYPTTHALWGDWANHAQSLFIVLYGYAAAKSERFWRAVDALFPLVAGFALVLGTGLFLAYLDWDATAENALAAWTARIARPVFAWMVILALLGAARRWFTNDNAARRYLSEAVFPYYILHQTITVTAGYALTFAGLSVWGEAVILIGATVLGCAIGYEIVRRTGPLRIVFGLKPALIAQTKVAPV